ncbi:Fanconi anemia group M protein homolog isoform X1 [Schistocerca americana]|uniref:Fanconi anemia group M protein homolog isoform X1 n=1 Tax=Schistocerca americana TaxID=7009 RepID=UPI001F4F24D4|nr:Fanconi anemia group M protein homolog isoform X1 [Schistocerca americana]
MSDEISLLDEDHDILLEALEGIAGGVPESSSPTEECRVEFPENIVGHLYMGEEAPGFDVSAGRTWKYPVDIPKRDYQFNIIQNALYHNTLVCLPTGMGKTFIAAVLMYNFYRWYPQGKVVFMAPTKPLVHQQVNACTNFTGLPKDSITIMTGQTKRESRGKEWEEKRVIFCTPQILMNDVSNNICQAGDFKCVVVDEAHKATGNHAYVQVIKQLRSKSAVFRILALSATPGSNFNAIQEVINNLQISYIEARTETSPDVAQYTHKRNIETVIVKITGYLKTVLDKFMNIIEIYVRPLIQSRLLSGTVRSLAKYKVLKSWEYTRSHPPQHISPHQLAAANADFAASVSLFHALELLTLHGLRSFVKFINGILKEDKSQPLVKTKLSKCDALISLIEEVEQGLGELKMLDPNLPASSQNKQKALPSHPKFEKLEELLKEHFCKTDNTDSNSKVIIFCQYRETVIEAFNLAKVFEPLMRPTPFMGQATTGKVSHGITQKQQLQVMEKFRSGSFNILISTCVGEEGLDIGEVDLIICFDAHTSPVRLMQRIGRTGRKREGKIIMLITDGAELQRYKRSLHQQDTVSKHIIDSRMVLCPNSPRMVPTGLNPKCHEIIVRVNQVDEKVTEKAVKKGKRKPKTMDLKTMWAKSFKKFGETEKCESATTEILESALLHDNEKESGDKCTVTAIRQRLSVHLPIMDPAFLYGAKKDELQDIFHHPTTQLPGNKSPVTERLLMHHQWTPQFQKTFLIGHSFLTDDLKSLFNLIESKQQNLPQTQTAELAKKMDSANLQPKTRKRKRAAEAKGLQTTEAKRKKLEDASLLFDKTFKLPVGIPSSRIRKVGKSNVTQEHGKDEDETIIPVDTECYFVAPKCNELDDLKEETRNCLKKVQELSNMANLFIKSFKFQNCCYSEPVISCTKLQQLSVSVTDVTEPPLIPGVLDRLCATYEEPVSENFNYVLKFNLVCNIDQFLSDLHLSPEYEDTNKRYFHDINSTESHFHEIKLPCLSNISSHTAIDLEVPSTSKAAFENISYTQIKSSNDSINCNKNSDFKTAEETSVHVSPLSDKIFNYSDIGSDIGDSSPVLSQKVRKDPVCSTPKISKRTLFKTENPTRTFTSGSKLALKSNHKDTSTREEIKTENALEVHDSKLKDGLNFTFKLVPEEEELLFSGIDSDSADEESVTQQTQQSNSQQALPDEESITHCTKQSKSQKVCADEESEAQYTDQAKRQEVFDSPYRMVTEHFVGGSGMEKPETEPQKCISLSSDSGDSEICKKPYKKNVGCFRSSTSLSETESIFNWYSSMQHEGNKAEPKISHNKWRPGSTSPSDTEAITDKYSNAHQGEKKTSTKISHYNKKTTANQETKTNPSTYMKRCDTENEDTSASHSTHDSSDSPSLDGVFVCNKQTSTNHRKTLSRKTAELEDNQAKNGKEKHKHHKIKFVDDECKVSIASLTISEDEESEGNSEYEASFLNEIPSEDSDYMVGKYLESVRSPMKGRGQFKIPEIKQHNKLDTSSDADEFNDTYARDSFCVDDMEVDSLHSDKNECDIEESRRYIRKRRRKVLKKSSKRWRRITGCHDSNTDETD